MDHELGNGGAGTFFSLLPGMNLDVCVPGAGQVAVN